MDAQILVEGKGIYFERGSRAVLDDVSMAVRKGEIVTLVGPNGGGKSTLTRILLGLQKPSRGSVRKQDGVRIGYVPQHIDIDPNLPLPVHRFLSLSGETDRTAMLETLQKVGAEHVLHTPFQEISGGEHQRVLLARALLRKPDLLVLDEPVQGVDVTGKAELYGLIRSVRDSMGCGVLMISHDLHLVMGGSDQVICLNGHICCAGQPESVSNDPAYIELFGDKLVSDVGIYHHHHDHAHDLQGEVVPSPPSEKGKSNDD